MISNDLHILLNPRLWVHKGKMPVTRRLGNPTKKGRREREHALRKAFNFGVVLEEDLTVVWVGVSVNDTVTRKEFMALYASPEKLLSKWEIAQ